MHFIKKIVCAVLLIWTLNAKAQITSFSTDPAVFINEFESFIATAGDRKLNDDVKLFKENWNLGKFSPNQQKSIIKISNDMLLERMNVQPYFGLMITSLASMIEKKLPEKVLTQWQQITGALLGESNSEYLDFLLMTSRLFQDNVLFEDLNKKWVADNNDFDILYEKGKIIVKFKALKLMCQGPRDKVEIFNTSGFYVPSQKNWYGYNGLCNFDRVMKEEKVEVEFGKYKIDLNESNFTVDSARLSFSKYFKDKILGKFDESMSYATDSVTIINSTFPKFSSYANTLEIKGIVGPTATFKGGFSIIGKEINTQTANGEETEINILYKGKVKSSLKASSFKISDGVAVSPSAKFTMYLDSGGTIYHPNAKVNFLFRENKLVVNRGEQGLQRVPFIDDYHKMDLDVQQVRWKVDEPFVDFDNVNNDQEAKIASADFFREIIYSRIQGPLQYNPLEAVMAFYGKELKKNKQMKFAVKDYANFMKTQPEYLITSFIDLHDGGFVNYYQSEDSVLIKPKLFNYVIAHEGHRDYDVIRLSSMISARSNATLNLLSNEMTVEGVLKFYFSDSQNVVVVPTDQKITLKKNRTIGFGGLIRAGRFDFYGQKFEFNYSNFQVGYTNIDSMRLYYPDTTGLSVVPIKSVLKNVYGTLYIDKPNNKSGVINYPEYPIFKSDKGADITYDKPHIYGGAYKSDKFKFEADPFTIDSLDNFTLEGLQFEGTFYSDGIFPDFRHHVSIQKDYSLGFVKPTPAGGYPMYRGKGTGEMVMSLSEEGFFGLDGSIGYNGSTTNFNKMLLLPDKAIGTAKSYNIPHGSLYPKTYAADAKIEWHPYQDEFLVSQGVLPIKVFQMGYDFYGNLKQTPTKLTGNGTLAWDKALFASEEMLLGPNKASADKASLKIYSADSTKIAFESNDIKGKMDFDTQLGTFTTNQKDAMTNFPFNMYTTNLNDYKWDMKAKTIEARVGANLAGVTPFFLSTNPTQDSLQFEAKRAIYNLNDYTLRIEQIPHIDIADSRMFLKDGIVNVRENANMDPVDSARIVANRIDKFHEIYNTRAKIYGRYKMRASGNYQYVDGMAKRQEFFLDSIIVNGDRKVEGVGRIQEPQGFTLDTKIGYKGFAQVLSTEKNILFTGYVKPLHTFKNVIPSAWIRYSDRLDPKNVVINMMDPRDKDDKKQYIGLFIANDSSHVYPLMYSWKRRYSDPDVTNDTGVLFYDHKTESFMAGSADKLIHNSLKGSYIQFNEADHTIHAEGPLDFGMEAAHIKFKNAGTADLKNGDTSFTFNMAMMLDFPLHKEVVQKIKENIAAAGPGELNANTDFFKRALGEMIEDEKNAKAIIKNIEKTGQLVGKDEADYKIVLNDATFRWDSKRRGMFCVDRVELINFAGTPVNKEINATILLEQKRSGENMYIYLEFGNNDWIYINLQKTVSYMLSSDPKVNEIILGTAEKIGLDDFYVRMATQRQVDKFLAKFE